MNLQKETKSFECRKSIRNHEKIMLGTSDAWSTSHSSQRTSIDITTVEYIFDINILVVESYNFGGPNIF